MPSEDASTVVSGGEGHTVSIGDVGLSPGEVRWSVDGTAVAVVDTIDGRWWPWFDDQSPLIGLIGFLAAALVLARSVLRLVRMPRIEGRAYCRRCNHDLDGGRAGEPCPECGCIQHGRERAVPTWRRSETLLLGLSLLVMVVGAGRLITRVQVQSAGQALASRGLAWPLASLQSVDGWPLWRVWRPQDDVRRAVVVRRDSSGRWSAGPEVFLPDGWWELSHDGQWITALRFEASSGFVPTLEWWATDTGEHHALELGTNADGFYKPCGFTPNGAIVVGLQSLVFGDPSGTSLSPFSMRAELIDPVTEARSLIGEGTMTATWDGSGWSLPTLLLAADDGSPRSWGAASCRQGKSDRIGDLRRGWGSLTEQGDDPLTNAPGMSTPHSVRLLDDGNVLEIRANVWAAGGAGIVVRRIDLVGGIVLDAPPIVAWNDPESGVSMAPSPDGAVGAGVVKAGGRRDLLIRTPHYGQ
jgi:hypothetical protein